MITTGTIRRVHETKGHWYVVEDDRRRRYSTKNRQLADKAVAHIGHRVTFDYGSNGFWYLDLRAITPVVTEPTPEAA